MTQKIKRNAAECAYCHKVLESRDVHDFRQHTCEQTGRVSREYDHERQEYVPAFPYFAVDGGLCYVRRLFGTKEDYIERSEYED